VSASHAVDVAWRIQWVDFLSKLCCHHVNGLLSSLVAVWSVPDYQQSNQCKVVTLVTKNQCPLRNCLFRTDCFYREYVAEGQK
jgi:hypothetical protein